MFSASYNVEYIYVRKILLKFKWVYIGVEINVIAVNFSNCSYHNVYVGKKTFICLAFSFLWINLVFWSVICCQLFNEAHISVNAVDFSWCNYYDIVWNTYGANWLYAIMSTTFMNYVSFDMQLFVFIKQKCKYDFIHQFDCFFGAKVICMLIIIKCCY